MSLSIHHIFSDIKRVRTSYMRSFVPINLVQYLIPSLSEKINKQQYIIRIENIQTISSKIDFPESIMSLSGA